MYKKTPPLPCFRADEAFKRLAQLRISAMQFSTKTKHIWKAAKDKALLDASKGQPVRDGDEYQDDNQSLYDDAENFSLTTHRLPAYVTHVTQMIRTAELASQQSEVRMGMRCKALMNFLIQKA